MSELGPTGGTSHLIGGCSYAAALSMAQAKAAEAGADGVYGIQTSAASNGKIVSLIAGVFRFKAVEAAPEATPEAQEAPVSAPPSPSPSIEQRLRVLQDLKDKNLITDEEYGQKRAEILKEI